LYFEIHPTFKSRKLIHFISMICWWPTFSWHPWHTTNFHHATLCQ